MSTELEMSLSKKPWADWLHNILPQALEEEKQQWQKQQQEGVEKSSIFLNGNLQIKASDLQTWKRVSWLLSHFAELTACKDNQGGHYSRIDGVGCTAHNWTHNWKWFGTRPAPHNYGGDHNWEYQYVGAHTSWYIFGELFQKCCKFSAV